MKRGNQNTIEDLLTPEVRNILKKYKRLGYLTESMGVEKNKCQDLKYLSDLSKYKGHKNYEEVKNLVRKLLKIKK